MEKSETHASWTGRSSGFPSPVKSPIRKHPPFTNTNSMPVTGSGGGAARGPPAAMAGSAQNAAMNARNPAGTRTLRPAFPLSFPAVGDRSRRSVDDRRVREEQPGQRRRGPQGHGRLGGHPLADPEPRHRPAGPDPHLLGPGTSPHFHPDPPGWTNRYDRAPWTESPSSYPPAPPGKNPLSQPSGTPSESESISNDPLGISREDMGAPPPRGYWGRAANRLSDAGVGLPKSKRTCLSAKSTDWPFMPYLTIREYSVISGIHMPPSKSSI